MMNNRKISFSLSLSLSTYRYSNEKKNSRKREGDPCLKRSTERKHVNWFTGAYRVRVFRRFCPELGHCLGYTHSWNSRGRRSGYGRNALLFFAPPSPFVTGSARWKKIVFIPRIRPGRPFVYVRPLRLYRDAFQNKQTNGWSSTKINCPLTIINRNSGNVPTLTEEFLHRFETAGKSRSNNSSSIFG